MKAKVEDKLAQLAFGELSPNETAKLEQEVGNDPEALRALSLYKDMREGLRSLSDIPEDQFSKERLRDAILTQGLRPVPSARTSNSSWLWMPATACVLGFAIMVGVNLNRKPAHTQVVLDTANPNIGISTAEPIKVAISDLPSPKPKTIGPVIGPKSNFSSFDAAKVKDPDEVDSRINASVDTESFDPDLGSIPPAVVQPTASHGAAVASNTAPSEASANAVPIVLIEQDKDEQTGAFKATEVGSSSNVLVGG